MKAVKYFAVYIFSLAFLFSCKPKEQTKQSLHQTTKDYFQVKDGSKYVFTETSDTSVTLIYTSANYINQQSNPDIENSEIMFYDLLPPASNFPAFTIRCETGGSEFRDRVALVVKRGDTFTLGAVMFNQASNFSTITGSGDSVFSYPTYMINGHLFDNVVRIKLRDNPVFREVFFAKNIGLIARKEKSGDKFYYVKRYSINK